MRLKLIALPLLAMLSVAILVGCDRDRSSCFVPVAPRIDEMVPLDEMNARDSYRGEDGGLYGKGRDTLPPALKTAAAAETAKIVPLDASGNPSASGVIGVVSISMPNATMEYQVFKQIADADPDKSPGVSIVDCAQGGMAMAQWCDPNGQAWLTADTRLANAGLDHRQVQVVWVKLANIRPTGELSEHGTILYNDTTTVLQNAKARFLNLRIAYLGSRIYGGYATTDLNPEPYAYEGGFVVRWLILDQMDGEPELNWDSSLGEVRAPLLLWGPYLWADGATPRKSDGLVWLPEDFSAADGTHPSTSGRAKVANLLLDFFKGDQYAKTWFLAQ
jgi:hypothetical protein